MTTRKVNVILLEILFNILFYSCYGIDTMSLSFSKELHSSDDVFKYINGHTHNFQLPNGDYIKISKLEPGFKLSRDLQSELHERDQDVCMTSHEGYCLDGSVHFTFTDASELDVKKGDVFYIDGDHDAENLGDQPCCLIFFRRNSLSHTPTQWILDSYKDD